MVAYPTSLESDFVGVVHGVYVPSTNFYNILPEGTNFDSKSQAKIGYVFSSCPFVDVSVLTFLLGVRNERTYTLSGLKEMMESGSAPKREFSPSMLTDEARAILEAENLTGNLVLGFRDQHGLVFVAIPDLKQCQPEPYALKLDVFSRNVGILESDIMLTRKVVLIGCGSVGSLIALELARAGVGHFLLIDNDTMGYHNICRHQCGILDVGKFKTNAVKERILEINPYAEVLTRNTLIQEVPVAYLEDFCDEKTLLIGGADNREGDLYANDLTMRCGSAFMSFGFWERAFAGEIFYCLPDGMPTYQDLVAVTEEYSGRVSQNRRFYTTEADLERASFEPGIYADINFVAIIAIKLALDILNRDNENYHPSVVNFLTQFTLICNTTNVENDRVWMFSNPLQITHSIEVPYATAEPERTVSNPERTDDGGDHPEGE